MRPWIAIVGAATSLAAFVPLVQHRANAEQGEARAPSAPATDIETLIAFRFIQGLGGADVTGGARLLGCRDEEGPGLSARGHRDR